FGPRGKTPRLNLARGEDLDVCPTDVDREYVHGCASPEPERGKSVQTPYARTEQKPYSPQRHKGHKEKRKRRGEERRRARTLATGRRLPFSGLLCVLCAFVVILDFWNLTPGRALCYQ